MACVLSPLIGRTIFSPILLLLLVGVVLYCVIEMRRHEQNLARIPIRIHVNGTRGKSSVTRLIAAGLRGGGVKTFAKTTGSAARMLHLDGSETPVERLASPNIREQLGIVRRAAEEGAQALVIECMAVRPDLQRISEKRIVRSTLGVITNVRPDHLEVMGPRLSDVALALSSTTPRGGKLFTTEARFADFLRLRAEQRGSTFHLTTPDREPTPAEMEQFSYVEIPENVALALDVCEAAGIDRKTALRGMYGVTPDIGAMTRTRVHREAKELIFYNAMAANDSESTIYLWQLLGLHESGDHEGGVLINNRGDRMRRAVEMAQIIDKDLRAAWYMVVGDQAPMFCDMAARNGVPREKLISMGGRTPDEVLDRMFEKTRVTESVMGIGNIGGFGVKFMTLLEEEGRKHGS
jgi:poly-gamma-glutamate synthase PgsB/CapB